VFETIISEKPDFFFRNSFFFPQNKIHINSAYTQQISVTVLIWFRKHEQDIYLDFCLTVHHQLGKVIQMNQLDATMIY